MFTVRKFNPKKVSWRAHVFGHKLSLKILFSLLNAINITPSQLNVININNMNHNARRTSMNEDKMIRMTLLKTDFRGDTTEPGLWTLLKTIYPLLEFAHHILSMINIPRRLLHIDILKVIILEGIFHIDLKHRSLVVHSQDTNGVKTSHMRECH